MAYTKTVWTDRQVQYPLRFQQSVSGTQVTLTPDEGSIIASGTPLTAANLNNIENTVSSLDTDNTANKTNITALQNKWSSGSGTPTVVPTAVGLIYIDTTNKGAYISTGTSATTDWEQLDQVTWANVLAKPTTISGYGITDHSWTNLLSKPTTLSGFGITDALSTAGGTATGNLTAPVLVSNVATGTAPLTVTSTTKVTNLNADQVDGYNFNQDVQTTASPSFNKMTSTVAVGTAPLTVTSTTAVTNLNADMVDGYHMNQDVRTTGTPTFATLVTTGIITAGTNITITPNATATSTTNYGSDAFQLQSSTWNGTAAVTNTRKMVVDTNNAVQFTNTSGTNVASIDNSGNISGNALQSIVATGTAPLTVASTTKVTNLNADLIDGYDTSTTAVASKIPVYNASAQLVGDITGNSASATKLQTARTIATSGDATGTATSFDGSANITIPLTLTNSGATAGTYKSVTVDAKGRVTGGTNPTTISGYGITDNTWANILSKPTTVSGFGITDAYMKSEVDSTFLAMLNGGNKVASGKTTGGTANYTTVTFPVAFTTVPIVLAVPNSSAGATTNFYTVTVTATSFQVYHTTADWSTHAFHWIAIGS